MYKNAAILAANGMLQSLLQKFIIMQHADRVRSCREEHQAGI
jgi:hypothetical protein